MSPSLASPCRPPGRTHLVPENKRAFRAGCHNVRRAVAIQIDNDELRADARAVVHQFGHEFGPAWRLRIAHRSVPVEDRRPIGIRIEMALEMRVEALAGDEIRN